MHLNHCILSCIAAAVLVAAPANADPWKNRSGHGRGGYRHEDNEHRHGRHAEEFWRHGGPPPWAPAHGYRARRMPRFRYHHAGHERYATAADTIILPSAGTGNCNREVVGGLIGAAAGGYLGSQVGSGSGKTAAVIGGTILGALVGGNIGRAMDQVDQNCVGQALERAPNGQPVAWQNPDAQTRYQVTPTTTYQRSDGRYCREYQTTIIIDGRTEEGYGTACRQPDGSWRKAG